MDAKSELAIRPVEHSDVSACLARVASLGSLVIGRPRPYEGYIDEAKAAETYMSNRPDMDKLKLRLDEASKRVGGFGRLREAAHRYFCSRNGEMGKRPHMLTSKDHRRRGAGSLLLRLPCYLQASTPDRKLYFPSWVQEYGYDRVYLSRL
ncbi:hypothetical protein CC80DRAFT_513585 [Byssothecium circinans]|uniref:Uncharacterized protein n=1 Tax=Byssothecium circinans TaxID=147558 RepID=A0A6A5U7K3_9PLEO|nr:hypothetical protein CC80DRAFT_513585 [Byssothecium circinans]